MISRLQTSSKAFRLSLPCVGVLKRLHNETARHALRRTNACPLWSPWKISIGPSACRVWGSEPQDSSSSVFFWAVHRNS